VKHLGHTRSAFQHDHLLQTPDTFVRAPLPGMTRATAVVHCGPALGAKFTQYTVEFESGGMLGPAQAQRFAYVLDGAPAIDFENAHHPLQPGSFVYLPENCEHRIGAEAPARVAIIEKSYSPIGGLAPPAPRVGYESSKASEPLLHDDALHVQCLLPEDAAFDFAVNVLTYQPGASLPMVEIHIMEHGLLMLEGEGIYRLGDCWYPVQAGDFIWMRAFCPQWFAALGKVPAKYLIYKDWNRSPLA
jgi:(S)-ureidoglycine aminohydrolase